MISVVIPTYRKPELLAQTLDALTEQVRLESGEWEVVVVDDGSGDDTRELLRAFSTRLPLCARWPHTNEGRARARNRGWRAARGSSVLFLDDDIVLEPGAVAAHLAAQRRHPAAYLGRVITDPQLIDTSLFDYLDSRGIAKHPPGSRVPARYLLTQNVSLPRSALIAVEGFAEDFGAYGFEDMEIAFRLEDRVGLEFFSLEGADGRHVHHHSLEEYLEKKRICGRETLPQIARLQPGRLAEMQLDLLVTSLSSFSRARGWLARGLRLSFETPLPRILRTLIESWPQSLAASARHRVYDYLVMDAYARGLRQRVTDDIVS